MRTADRETPPEHPVRIYRALAGPKSLRLVEGAGHNQSLTGEVWNEIEGWILERATPRQ